MATTLWLFLVCGLIIGNDASKPAKIMAVLDERLIEYNGLLERMLAPVKAEKLKTTIIRENDTVATFREVLQECKAGASILLDMSSSTIGPLLRSYARANGMLAIPVMDESFLLPADKKDPFHIRIEPPGTAMLRLISDVIQLENLTNVAIIYDDSFSLHEIPRRVVSGLLTHHVYQQIPDRDNITQLLSYLQTMEIDNIFLIGAATTVEMVLQSANNKDELINNNKNWLVITKDAEINCDGCKRQISVTAAMGNFSYEQRQKYLDYVKSDHDSNYRGHQIKMDEVFAYDMRQIFEDKIPNNTHLNRTPSCYGNISISNATQNENKDIIANLQHVNHPGVFGQIVSENGYIRQKIRMTLKNITFRHGSDIGTPNIAYWSHEDGFHFLNTKTKSVFRAKNAIKYKVVVVPEYEPFIYKVNESGTMRYRGFCIDFFAKVAEKVKFDYDLNEVEDKYFGSLNDDGTWNGAIRELIEKRADIAIGPISVMSERENVVDFTVPFHEPVGLTILMRKQKFEYSLHKFLTVLETDVWGCILGSYFLFSVLMWLFDKFSPFSYQNNPSSSNTVGPEKRVFTLKEGIWFCMTSLTPQGGGEAPKAVSGRLIAATWWLYGFLLIAFYTANLAAFLTVTRLETPITSLDDLSKQHNIKYGPMNGTSALIYFDRMSLIEKQFYEIWKRMSLNDSLSPVERAKLAVWDYPVSEQFTKLKASMETMSTYEEAMRKVKSGELAFIDDATRNKYRSLTDCDVEHIGEEFSRKPFAFAVVQGSPLRSQMSNAMLELANDRVLEDLTNKWWDSNSMRKDCPKLEDESDGISIMNIGGVFLVIAIGTGMSLVAFVFEYYYYRIQPQREARLYDLNKNARDSGASIESNNTNDTANTDFQLNIMNGTSGLESKTEDSENGHVNTTHKRNKHKYKTRTDKCDRKQHDRNRRNSSNNNNSELSPSKRQQNGHVGNGISNTFFTFDTEGTFAERFASIRDQAEVDIICSEKL